MKSIHGGLGKTKGPKAPVRGAAPKPKLKGPAKKLPVKPGLVVFAVVRDKVTKRPIGGAAYEIAKKGAEGKPLGKGTTAFAGIVEAAVPTEGPHVVRVTSVKGHPPAKKPLGSGTVPARPAAKKGAPTPILIAPLRGGGKKQNPKNKKPAAKKKKKDELHLRNPTLAWSGPK